MRQPTSRGSSGRGRGRGGRAWGRAVTVALLPCLSASRRRCARAQRPHILSQYQRRQGKSRSSLRCTWCACTRCAVRPSAQPPPDPAAPADAGESGARGERPRQAARACSEDRNRMHPPAMAARSSSSACGRQTICSCVACALPAWLDHSASLNAASKGGQSL
jgi:hypothetical protein